MYVTPKTNCPHVNDESYVNLEGFKQIDFEKSKCKNCTEEKENWICLSCGEFFCSRYINSHFVAHNLEHPLHNICLSMMDLSFWCYECESYIISRKLNKYYDILSNFKFGKDFIPTVTNLTNALDLLKIDSAKAKEIKYKNFIEFMKSGKFKKTVFITGAGISTTAGIPDFRSSENGLFKTLQSKYGLSSPEEFFEIDTFKSKPELFYDFAKEFDLSKYNATPSHWFMSFLDYKGMLNLVFTQNIDSLEFKAKLPREKICFAHGNLLEAHCANCHKDVDINEQQNSIKEGKILYCQEPMCKGPCKPKVVFYGESLPKEFFVRLNELSSCDLGIVMGTSLKVMPFNMLPYQLPQSSWRLVINRERVGREDTIDGFSFDDITSHDLFLEGTTDDIVLQIINDCGWREEFDKFVDNKLKEN